jgi:hypothetical protein
LSLLLMGNITVTAGGGAGLAAGIRNHGVCHRLRTPEGCRWAECWLAFSAGVVRENPSKADPIG